MYDKNDKRRLYQLMDMLLTNFITAPTFTDEFYYSYNLEVKDEDLTELEQKAFSELEKVSSRFSEFEEDHIKYPNTYFTEKELRDKVSETRDKLKGQCSF